MTSRRIDQIPASKGVTTADQIAIWQDGRTRVATIQDVITGPIYDVVEGITGINPGDPSGNASLKKAANLSDLVNFSAARNSLGLGTAATRNVGISGGVAAYDDPRFGQGGGGSTGPITASQITDASASGRSILTGTPAASRVALGLGTAAVLAVGVSGGVAAYDDPRFSSGGGGGGAPSTVTASQISDGSASGRSVLTGTPLQGRNALEMVGIQSVNPEPPWADGTGQFDRFRVSVGPTTLAFWAGGDRDKPANEQTLGHYSAITGTLNLPVESNQAVNAQGIPKTIISAGVSGLVQTSSNQNVAVGLFTNARVNVPNGRVWGLNVVTSNFSSSFTVPQYGNAAQINGIEIDTGWKATQNPTTGSNVLGIWIPAEFTGGRPDGAADAIRIGRYTDFPWKNFLSADHGSADVFADLGMVKAPFDMGPSPSSGMHWITSRGGQKTANSDTNDYRHSYLSVNANSDIVFQPDYFGGQASLIVGNFNLSQVHRIHHTDGFIGSKADLGSIKVTNLGQFGSINTTGGASVGGNLGVNGSATISSLTTGNASVNGALTVASTLSVNGGATISNINTGNLVATGAVTAPGLIFRGLAVQLSTPSTIPPNANVLIVIP